MIPEFAGATPYGIFLWPTTTSLPLALSFASQRTSLVRRYSATARRSGRVSSRPSKARFRKAITGLARYHLTIQSEV